MTPEQIAIEVTRILRSYSLVQRRSEKGFSRNAYTILHVEDGQIIDPTSRSEAMKCLESLIASDIVELIEIASGDPQLPKEGIEHG